VACLDRLIKAEWLWWMLFAVFLGVLPGFLDLASVRLVVEMMILAVFAVSVNLLFGFGGMLSFGQAAYFGVGAYTVAVLTVRAGVPYYAALALAPVLSALVALVVGFFCVRLTEIYFSMLSLGFAQVLFAIVQQWYSFTGGDDGLQGLPIPAWITDIPFTGLYYFVGSVSLVCLLLMRLIVSSPFGYILRTVRDNAERAQFYGLHVRLYRLLAFVVAGFFGGMAGGLFPAINQDVYPNLLFWSKSAEPLFAIILGGMGSFFGPVVGAALFMFLEDFINSFTTYWPIVMGGLLVLLVIGLPSGIVGFLQDHYRAMQARRLRTVGSEQQTPTAPMEVK
jgi:branched-chain amino acid transport system permease protein